eukprot:jgi/Tetstr1/436540/TSEL_002695.t1
MASMAAAAKPLVLLLAMLAAAYAVKAAMTNEDYYDATMPLEFCNQFLPYEADGPERGFCTRVDDAAIEQLFRRVVASRPDGLREACETQVQRALCQQCAVEFGVSGFTVPGHLMLCKSCSGGRKRDCERFDYHRPMYSMAQTICC